MSNDVLTNAQQNALAHVRALAEAQPSRRTGGGVLGMEWEALQAQVVARLEAAPVTINFHPDRVAGGDRTVVEALLEEGRYVSQFTTGISNGGLTAYRGGARFGWESRLFGGAYDDAPAQERPLYGGLNLMRYPDGACPRFGSCHLRLKPHVVARVTCCWGDSCLEPERVGVAGAMDEVAAGVLMTVADEGEAFARVMSLDGLLGELDAAIATPQVEPGRALDSYVEVQVHGGIELARDVEAVVMDPSFVGSSSGEQMALMAERWGLVLETHLGFELPPEAMPDALRGAEVPKLARRVQAMFCPGRPVQVAAVGQAAQSVVRTPEVWEGDPAETLQHLKYIWHHLVVAGVPLGTWGGATTTPPF